VRLLLDQNLSRHLGGPLAVEFPGQLAFLNGPPPKAVWSRLGNVSTLDVLKTLRSHRNASVVFSASADEALLVVPST